MKAELNLENKAKFFAQYLGCGIAYQSTDGKLIVASLTGVSKGDGLETTYKRKKKGCSGDYLAFRSNGNHESNGINAKIILKPISSITDEDAELAGISKRRLKQHISHHCIMTPLMDQILRSKGYALPWMGLSVQEICEAGWIKLKES